MLKSVEGITFNDVNLQERFTDENNAAYDYFIVNDVVGRGLNSSDVDLITVNRHDGAYVTGEQRPPRYLDVSISIKSPTHEGLRKKLDEVNELLNTDYDAPIVFDDEGNRTYFGRLSDVDGNLEKSTVYQAVLTFLCSDPFKYGPEKTLKLEDISTIENKGTAEADPIFELTAKEKTTFAMVSLGADEDAEYNLIGTPAEVDEQVVDTRKKIFEERGQTLDEWTSTGTSVDGTVSGELNTDNDGITVPDYGEGKGWHGPALMREIDPIQDFEVEMMLRAETRNTNQTFRIEFYLFDENMGNLGKMAIMDKNDNFNKKKGEGRYGPKGDRYERYAISDKDYEYNVAKWFGMLRMTREDDKMTFYITRINSSNKHVRSLKESVRIDDDLMGKLKYVQIHIGKYGDTPSASAPRILSIKAYELSEATIDQTPYIVYPNDKIVFDHKEDRILVNGEPRPDLNMTGAFGGSFFKLPKGTSNIIVTPSDTFDTTVTYRNKYL